MSKCKDLFSSHGGVFLAPQYVGSSISWYVNLDEYTSSGPKKELRLSLNGSVRLSDCSRTISWEICGEDDLAKLDKAIAALKAARRALAKSVAIYNEHPAKPVDRAQVHRRTR